jgi:flavodoxin
VDRALIAYHSHSKKKFTAKLAEDIAAGLKERGCEADLVEIVPSKRPNFLSAMFKARKVEPQEIENKPAEARDYDVIAVGSPVWAGFPTSYLQKFIESMEGAAGKKAIIFGTCGGNPGRYEELVEGWIKKKEMEITATVMKIGREPVDIDRFLESCKKESNMEESEAEAEKE